MKKFIYIIFSFLMIFTPSKALAMGLDTYPIVHDGDPSVQVLPSDYKEGKVELNIWTLVTQDDFGNFIFDEKSAKKIFSESEIDAVYDVLSKVKSGEISISLNVKDTAENEDVIISPRYVADYGDSDFTGGYTDWVFERAYVINYDKEFVGTISDLALFSGSLSFVLKKAVPKYATGVFLSNSWISRKVDFDKNNKYVKEFIQADYEGSNLCGIRTKYEYYKYSNYTGYSYTAYKEPLDGGSCDITW